VLSVIVRGPGLEVLAIIGMVLFVVVLLLVSWLAWRKGGCLGCLWVWLSVFDDVRWSGRSGGSSKRWGGFGGGGGAGGAGGGRQW
jgi:hypothetical protein